MKTERRHPKISSLTFHILFWCIIFCIVMIGNMGNYAGNIVHAAGAFLALVIPVYYALCYVIANMVQQKAWQEGLIRLVLLYGMTLIYAYQMIYRVLPQWDINYFNPLGTFSWIGFVGVVTKQFLVVALFAGLSISLRSNVSLKDNFTATQDAYQLANHFDNAVLTFVADKQAEDGNWTGYDLISELNLIKRYTASVSANGGQLVSIEQEWQQVMRMIHIIHMQKQRTDIVDVQIKGDWCGQLLPPCVLLTLMENIAQYAVLERPHGVKVQLELYPDGFCFRSQNLINRKTTWARKTGKGKGLPLLKKRLKLLMPEQYEFLYWKEKNVFYAQLNTRNYGKQKNNQTQTAGFG